MIALVDYGLGNIRALANIYRRLGLPVTAASVPQQLRSAKKIILPGVGAFDWAMQKLEESGLRATLDELVLEHQMDVLGICVGMQIMADRSEEGKLPGLGWISGEVRRLPGSHSNQILPLPHMGWNKVVPMNQDDLFRGVQDARFYFLHSYYMAPAEAAAVLAMTTYGYSFASAVRAENIYGVQFHPEKSHGQGVQLLRNFVEM